MGSGKGSTVTLKTKRRIRLYGRILFIIYILGLIYFLFFSEWYGRTRMDQQEYRYNLILFQEIQRFWTYRDRVGWTAAFLNIAGNIIGFLPFGFILPVMHPNFKSICLTGILGFCLSLFVETMQLICHVGCFDVDDLLLNTCGAVLGYIGFIICDRWRIWYYAKKI